MLLGTNRNDDAHKTINPKSNLTKDDKSNDGGHLNDEVFEQENEKCNELNQSVSGTAKNGNNFFETGRREVETNEIRKQSQTFICRCG